jgi:hypothetical protein
MIIGYTTLTYTQFSGSVDYVGGTNINITGQTISLTGTVAATNGGTGANTVTTGDLLYGSATNTWSKLPIGSGYKSLTVNAGGTQVEWNAVALDQSGAVSGTLPATSGGTGQTTYTVGDTLYSGATNTLAKLAGNTTTTKKFLGQTGTGAASAAPVWQQPAATDITGLAASATTDTTNASNITTGTLGTSRLSGSYTGVTGVGTLTAGTWNASVIGAVYGGTGQSSYAVGDLVYANTTTTLAKLADVAVGNALISGGVGSAPSYGKIGLATHVDGTLPVANGGTGNTSGNAATVTNGLYTTGGQAVAARNTQQGSQTATLATATGSLGGLEMQSANSSGAAFMAFHRPGAFAGYFGIDTDNVLKVGGWSFGAVGYPISYPTSTYAPGTAPTYSPRAWVNFDGTGTVAIRASGNVSSITDNGVGNYTVNFSTALSDANYCALASVTSAGSANSSTNCVDVFASAANTRVNPTSSAFRLFVFHPGNQVAQDAAYVTAAAFR